MNVNIDDKLNMLPHIAGKNVLDVGCGGGGLMKVLSEAGFNAYGIDASDKVAKMFTPVGRHFNMQRNFIKGDARDVHNHIEYGEIDTVLFSSVLHEVYSYSDFNMKAVEDALKSAWKILPRGGRLIIRDGINSDKWQHNIIQFHDKNDLNFVSQYSEDFKGRKISPTYIDDNKVFLPHNDCMELLYTYTWGWESYEREVREQFGIMSPTQYIKFIETHLDGARVVSCNNYLQEGYNHHLLKRIKFMDESGQITRLPDSTALFVIEKTID